MILADNHETRGVKIDGDKYKIPNLLEKYGIKTQIMPLEVGDYVMIGPTRSCCVETKSAEDYLGSIESGQLDVELLQMSANYDKNVLLIFGSIEKALVYRKMNRQTYSNYLAGCIIRESPEGKSGSVSVVNFNHLFDAVQLIKTLHDLIVGDDIFRQPKAKRIKPSPGLEKQFSIETYPSIGPKRAKDLKNKFKTIRNLSNATREELVEVDGIGKKIADGIWRHVNEE